MAAFMSVTVRREVIRNVSLVVSCPAEPHFHDIVFVFEDFVTNNITQLATLYRCMKYY